MQEKDNMDILKLFVFDLVYILVRECVVLLPSMNSKIHLYM